MTSSTVAKHRRASPSIAEHRRPVQNASVVHFRIPECERACPSVRPPARPFVHLPARPSTCAQSSRELADIIRHDTLRLASTHSQSAKRMPANSSGQALTAKQPQYGRPLAEPCWTSPKAYLPPLPLPLLLLPPTAGYCHHHHHYHCCYYQSLRGCLTMPMSFLRVAPNN